MSYPNYLNATTPKNYFHACLRDESDQLLEMGKGNISFEEHSVDFMSDFVPLMKYKSTAKIIKLIDGEECHSFTGQVYLSSKTRLQLLNITDSFLTYKELQVAQKVKIKGSITSSLTQPPQDDQIEIEIFSISMSEVNFTVSKEYQLEQYLTLLMDNVIPTSGIVLNVYRQLQFSVQKTACYATIEHYSMECRKALTDFLAPKFTFSP